MLFSNKKNEMKIIAFTGCKMVGKSTLAKTVLRLSEKPAKIMSFADPLRAMLSGMGVKDVYMNNQSLKELPIEGLDKSARELMQTLGTEWGRNMVATDIWIWAMNERIAKEKANGVELVIIDDLRFENEADWVLSLGGSIARLVRDGYDYGTDDHASEKPICAHKTSMTLDAARLHESAWICLTMSA